MNLFQTICLVVSCSLLPPLAAQDKQTAKNDPRVGKKFIVTVAGAPLRTPEKIVWKAYLGETFTPTLTNGEWLWIPEKGGWLWDKESVQFDKAIEEMTERLQKEKSVENYQLRGIAYAAHERFEEAINDYTAALKQKPNDAGVLNNRGQAYYLQDSFPKAVADFDLAIRADSKHFVAMNNRALCRIATSEFDKAIKDLNAAIALNKEYPEALNNRGVCHSRKGDFAKAVQDFSAAITIDEKFTDAFGNRSFAYRKLGKLKEAVADLKTAIRKTPLDYKPVNDLAWIHATTSDAGFRKPDEAIKMATKACEMTQWEDSNTLDTLAAAYAAAGKFKESQQWILTAIEKASEEEKPSLEAHKTMFLEDKAISE